jgi:predicted GIY-YIG superfamily endonuclease
MWHVYILFCDQKICYVGPTDDINKDYISVILKKRYLTPLLFLRNSYENNLFTWEEKFHEDEKGALNKEEVAE